VDIAIVAMDCILPGSTSAEEWIAASRAGTPAVSDVPKGRWPMPPQSVLSSTLGAADATPTLRGGFVDPGQVEGAEDCDAATRLVIRTVRNVAAGFVGKRTDLLLANLSLPTSDMVRASAFKASLNGLNANTDWLSDASPDSLKHGEGPAVHAAKILGIGGHVTALDAACASGLYAVQLACDRLAAGLCDVAIAAAVQAADSAFLFLGFAQLRALATDGVARPFDVNGTGLLVGEGAAAVTLKRLSDAQADGDTIHGILRGGGLGNDGKKGNLLAPSASGQERALRQAYTRAQLAPADVGYTECHATGTQLGDGTELTTLGKIHSGRTLPMVVSSTKGQIGHTITVAGLAGLIRATGAVRDGFFPPTPGCTIPLEMSEYLRVLHNSETWNEDQRVAAVSAFGFGGTNAHVLVSNVASRQTPPEHTGVDLFIHGVGARIGDAKTTRASVALAHTGTVQSAPAHIARGTKLPVGTYMSAVHTDAVGRRIPPSEAAQILPQQLAMLEAAADALALADVDHSRTACIIGMTVDPQISEHTLRWLVDAEHRDAVSPPLTSARVQGVLPNLVANRISATFDLQGPSYTVSSGDNSLHTALQHAERLLATGVADAVIVGAVDLPGHVANHPQRPIAEGAIAFLVTSDLPSYALANVDALAVPTAAHHDRLGHMGAADSALTLLLSLDLDTATLADTTPERSMAIPHDSGLPLAPDWLGDWTGDTVPLPNLHAAGPKTLAVFDDGPPLVSATLAWTMTPAHDPAAVRPLAAVRPPAPARKPVAAAKPVFTPPPIVAVTPSLPLHSGVSAELTNLALLARQMAATTQQTANAHAAFLASQARATEQLGRLASLLDTASSVPANPAPLIARATKHNPAAQRTTTPQVSRSAPAVVRPRPVPAENTVSHSTNPRELIDRAGLEHLAHGSMSKVLGAAYADLDHISPRVRLPMGELLLVSRVTSVDGERGPLKGARMTTEYDLPTDASWVHQGKPPPCVVVESGQADLLLCAILGTDDITQGKALYRLLDCDLTFHGDRPPVGETLCHDIRIKTFARMGETILFYFEYDCTAKSDGRKILTMRQGVAGFFPPASLAVPQGVDPTPGNHPTQTALTPLIAGAPTALDDAAVSALTRGEYSRALGSVFAPADGAEMRLPSGKWSLLNRVDTLQIAGGPHGLGQVIAQQDLRDDDWFNAMHFKDDPCMPGTLMFDGCTQSLSIWLMAHGFPAMFPNATFEPVAGVATRLRCRGQVVPGHSQLTYDVRPKSAGIDPTPWVIADVILFVDGTPVVFAEDVSLRISGEAVALPVPTSFTETQHLEFSIGDPSKAFGPNWTQYDNGARTPRMPGPPLLMLSRAERIDAPKEQLTAPASVNMAYDVPTDAFWWDAVPDTAMPLAILLEIALQPCGWLTAWQGAALGTADLYFRNLGGTATWHAPVLRTAGTLHTTAKLVSVSASGGMTLVFFEMETRQGDTLVLSGDTHFGYFTEQAIAEQKGLGLLDEDRRAALRAEHAVNIDVTAPRADVRMLDRITARGPDFVAAEKDVDPNEWFFTAHFHQDPVMPGSLGLDGLAQLARWELEQRAGAPSGIVEPIASGTTVKWRYRGQVNTHRKALQYELDVREVTLDGEPHLVGDGVVRADGMAIYELTGLAVRFAQTPQPVQPTVPARANAYSALIDELRVDGDSAVGRVHLDPAVHPWLADHAPTLVIPAVPMAFAAEIAAEAALALHPGATITGIPSVVAEQWIHTGDGPVQLFITAVSDGTHVAVSLAVHHENPKFPKLSGPKVHMRAVVQVGQAYDDAPPAPAPLEDAVAVDLSAADYYTGGLTFHGPVLQAVQAFHDRGPSGITATFATRPDADLLPASSPNFVLDPLLLDAATHPMFSGSPELWNSAIPAGKLAYPVSCDTLRFYSDRPSGEVNAHLVLVHADAHTLVFDVTLTGSAGIWTTFRWTEALVDGGPVLGCAPETIARFAKHRLPDDVNIGHLSDAGWVVAAGDLVEPIEGTLVRLLGRREEIDAWQQADDRVAFACALLSAKQAVRHHVRATLDRDVHPADLRLVRTRTDRFVVAHASGLTAQEFIDVLAATRFVVDVEPGTTRAVSRVRPLSSPLNS
jgi:3-oxoacyl-(acyl-carrier-protein) synthase/3-hydroxymyristoyl/3-hydroxydecanoyl-(acyl carrier protein) dehydratase